ncbi:serine hydrolase domain-containing protein [Actinospica robiniae]|uniref:serine hydrolase domain-containing protein n=1 Tax=Actinospica robiniae TaxID=304901 RepID=UPI00040B17CE|nr:serine hydrolase domain-containing protein [Actinospica robiniae]
MQQPEFTAEAHVDEFAALFPDAPSKAAVALAAMDGPGITTAMRGQCPVDARFEIGSITKTMTATLLASLAADDVLALDDDLERWVPAAAGKGLKLQALATHTSGLPRLAPNNLWQALAHPRNPYVGYSAKRAEKGLRAVPAAAASLDPAPHQYSNFGYQLLGLALERASGQSYQQMLKERITGPLGMTSTGVRDGVPRDGDGGVEIPGHAGGRAVPHWDQPMPGAGGVESTIGDMARYLAACAHPADDAPGEAIRLAQSPRLVVAKGKEIGLGWIRWDARVLWHNGKTGGFCSSMALDPQSGRGMVLLASSTSGSGSVLDQRVIRLVRDGR